MKKVSLDLNLTEFVKTGKFGFIDLGNNKTELEELKFSPESCIDKKSADDSRIWKYGNFEVYFDDGYYVTGIYNDQLSKIEGGKRINIKDRWIFDESDAPTLKRTIEELNKMGMDYAKTTHTSGSVTVTLNNGVYMLFEKAQSNENPDSNEYKMEAIAKTQNAESYTLTY